MKRNCYCDLRKTRPETFGQQGIPEGYCGICERCGRPGHTSHHPGPVPYTGAWCDRCFRILTWTWLFRAPLFWPVLGLLGWIGYRLLQAVTR